jgi:predicted alpha/beta hydrolase
MLACVADGFRVRGYGQRPFDRVAASDGFKVLEDENAHGGTKAADPASARHRGLETVSPLDLTDQLADTDTALHGYDLESVPNRVLNNDTGWAAIGPISSRKT